MFVFTLPPEDDGIAAHGIENLPQDLLRLSPGKASVQRTDVIIVCDEEYLIAQENGAGTEEKSSLIT